MKPAVIAPMNVEAISIEGETGRRIGADFAELVKARLTLLVLFTTAAGFYLGAVGSINYIALFHAVFGTALAAAGAAALNQWWERRLDALMLRTRERPIPAGRMLPRSALIVGIALAIAGIAYLTIACNALSAALAALTIAIYIFAYTPLKLISTANTLVGAIPGGLPPMIGWAAASGRLDPGAWSLFAILFLWQMPHFFAIAWMYREDYARAGFQMVRGTMRPGHGARVRAFCSVFFSFSPAELRLFSVSSIPSTLRWSWSSMVCSSSRQCDSCAHKLRPMRASSF